MTIDDGVAYGEPFQQATSSLRFDGTGVRLDNLNLAKGAGAITGAAFVGWDSTYSFNADGRRIPVERLAFVAFPRAPLSGLAEFTASGSGTFESPRNDFRFRVDDLFVGEEGVGVVTGTLALRGSELSGDDRRGVAAPGAHRHRPHRADAAGGRGADVPLPRQLARSLRPAVRAEALAVHHRRRQRRDSRGRRARRRRSPASSTARSTRSTCGCSTTR